MFLFLLVFAFFLSFQTVEPWQKVKVLHTPRKEVESYFHPGDFLGKNVFQGDTFVMAVWYSEGTCRSNPEGHWDIPPEIVVGMLVSPRNSRPLSSFPDWNPADFTRTAVPGFKRCLYVRKDGQREFETQINDQGHEEVIYEAFRPDPHDPSVPSCKADRRKLVGNRGVIR